MGGTPLLDRRDLGSGGQGAAPLGTLLQKGFSPRFFTVDVENLQQTK